MGRLLKCDSMKEDAEIRKEIDTLETYDLTSYPISDGYYILGMREALLWTVSESGVVKPPSERIITHFKKASK